MDKTLSDLLDAHERWLWPEDQRSINYRIGEERAYHLAAWEALNDAQTRRCVAGSPR